MSNITYNFIFSTLYSSSENLWEHVSELNSAKYYKQELHLSSGLYQEYKLAIVMCVFKTYRTTEFTMRFLYSWFWTSDLWAWYLLCLMPQMLCSWTPVKACQTYSKLYSGLLLQSEDCAEISLHTIEEEPFPLLAAWELNAGRALSNVAVSWNTAAQLSDLFIMYAISSAALVLPLT